MARPTIEDRLARIEELRLALVPQLTALIHDLTDRDEHEAAAQVTEHSTYIRAGLAGIRTATK